jgi:PAS domain S-box-containing protein
MSDPAVRTNNDPAFVRSGAARGSVPFEALFQFLPENIVVVRADDPSFTIVAVSDTHLQFVRGKREETVGRGFFEVFPEGPDPNHAATMRQLRISFRLVIATGQPDTMPMQRYDLPRHDSDGGDLEERYWGPVNSPVIGPDNVVQFVIHRAEDVTALVQMRRKEKAEIQCAETERLRAEEIQAELLFSSRLLSESQGLIEQRDQLVEDLERSEARFRAAVGALSSLLWTNNARGEMEGEQPGWAGYTGQRREEYQGYGWTKAVHPDDAQPTVVAWNEAVAQRRMFVFEHRVRRYDGVYRLFSIRAVPVMDDNRPIREWVGVHTDITEEQKLVEERTVSLSREHEARETAELLNKVGPLLAAELDTQALTQKVTDLATQLTGAQFGALFHKRLNEQGESYTLYTLSGVPREEFSKFPMPRNTKVFGPTFRGEGVMRLADITKDSRYGQNAPYRGMPEGHLPVRSYLAVPVVSRSGEVLGGLFFGHGAPDQFTEQHEKLALGIAAQAAIALDNAHLFEESRRSRQALERSNAELRRANEDLEQFAYSASHDLQEPLRMVAIYSQLLQTRYASQLDGAAQEYLSYAVAGAKRMELLIKDLLSYTQAVTIINEDVAPVDASIVLKTALENLHGAIQETGARIDSSAMPALLVQEIHLLQLFQNLVGNAIKYHGQAPPVIQVAAERQNNMWRLCVRDNGIGINPEYSELVFGIFKRLHNSADYQGTGIGLAICQKIVERYGGRIWVESEEGRGAAFYFTLPGGEYRQERSAP